MVNRGHHFSDISNITMGGICITMERNFDCMSLLLIYTVSTGVALSRIFISRKTKWGQKKRIATTVGWYRTEAAVKSCAKKNLACGFRCHRLYRMPHNHISYIYIPVLVTEFRCGTLTCCERFFRCTYDRFVRGRCNVIWNIFVFRGFAFISECFSSHPVHSTMLDAGYFVWYLIGIVCVLCLHFGVVVVVVT